MAISLGQKLNHKFRGIYKWLLGFFITDEIFILAIKEREIKRGYFLGVVTLPYFGWAIGTICGILLGSVLPIIVLESLGIAIFGMFIAIIVPDIKKDHKVILAVIIGIFLSCMFYYIPKLNSLSSGITVSICAVVAAIIASIIAPVKEEK